MSDRHIGDTFHRKLVQIEAQLESIRQQRQQIGVSVLHPAPSPSAVFPQSAGYTTSASPQGLATERGVQRNDVENRVMTTCRISAADIHMSSRRGSTASRAGQNDNCSQLLTADGKGTNNYVPIVHRQQNLRFSPAIVSKRRMNCHESGPLQLQQIDRAVTRTLPLMLNDDASQTLNTQSLLSRQAAKATIAKHEANMDSRNAVKLPTHNATDNVALKSLELRDEDKQQQASLPNSPVSITSFVLESVTNTGQRNDVSTTGDEGEACIPKSPTVNVSPENPTGDSSAQLSSPADDREITATQQQHVVSADQQPTNVAEDQVTLPDNDTPVTKTNSPDIHEAATSTLHAAASDGASYVNNRHSNNKLKHPSTSFTLAQAKAILLGKSTTLLRKTKRHDATTMSRDSLQDLRC